MEYPMAQPNMEFTVSFDDESKQLVQELVAALKLHRELFGPEGEPEEPLPSEDTHDIYFISPDGLESLYFRAEHFIAKDLEEGKISDRWIYMFMEKS